MKWYNREEMLSNRLSMNMKIMVLFNYTYIGFYSLKHQLKPTNILVGKQKTQWVNVSVAWMKCVLVNQCSNHVHDYVTLIEQDI